MPSLLQKYYQEPSHCVQFCKIYFFLNSDKDLPCCTYRNQFWYPQVPCFCFLFLQKAMHDLQWSGCRPLKCNGCEPLKCLQVFIWRDIASFADWPHRIPLKSCILFFSFSMWIFQRKKTTTVTLRWLLWAPFFYCCLGKTQQKSMCCGKHQYNSSKDYTRGLFSGGEWDWPPPCDSRTP